MRIGTWNVEHAREGRMDRLKSMLARYPAAVWVLTETHDDLVPPRFAAIRPVQGHFSAVRNSRASLPHVDDAIPRPC